MSDSSDDSFSPFPFSRNIRNRKYRAEYREDFSLKLSEYSIIEDTQDILSENSKMNTKKDSIIEDTQDILTENSKMNTRKDSIIVISDSSPDNSLEYCSKEKISTPVIPKNTYKSAIRSINYTLEISDNSDDDKTFNEKYRNVSTRNRRVSKFSNSIDKINSRDKNYYCTSDDSSKDSSMISSEHNKKTNAYKKDINPTLLNMRHKNENSNRQLKNTLKNGNSVYTPVSKYNSLSKLTDINSNSSKKSNTPVQLTNSDLNKILKNIKSTKAVYESPRTPVVSNIVINETLDEGELHPALSSDDSLIKRFDKPPATIIDETNSDISKSNFSERNMITSYKIYDKSINAPVIDDKALCLTEELKQEICNWIKMSSPHSISDSSFTNVSASIRNSINSGNSSLERLELNYETPNNRNIIKLKIIENNVGVSNTNNKTSSMSKSKQETPHKFLRKLNENVLTPSSVRQKKKATNQCINLDTKQSNNMNIAHCTDILDELYGNIWRNNATALLSTPTNKQKNVITKDKAVQTERKATSYKYYTTKLGDKQNRCDTSQKQLKHKTQRNSFICDSSSSDTETQSLYFTALTTPLASDLTPNKINTKSRPVQRLFEICDSDTDDEYSTNPSFEVRKILNKKNLSFNDEEGSSDTSEFDPSDDITKKRVYKKSIKKTTRNVAPTKQRDLSSEESEPKNKHKGFLASLSDSVPLINAHPDAKKYRLAYKNNKEELCKYLYKLYNENIFDKKLPENMLIEWNVRMRGTAGYCYNKKSIKPLGGILRSSRVVLSTKVLDTPDRLRDTLIHEMCHAATWLINDVSDGHGPFWTAWANKAIKVFPELPPIRRCHDYKIKTKFTYRCIECGYSIGRHSKSLDIEKKRCGHCYGKFELLINKTTKSGTVQVQTPKREPSAFALYVKKNYNTVKKEKNLKHAEVMKVLGQKFSAIKITKKNVNDD
ncbi:PREDICTED: MATH and LRR domain-containing protein PFE0570w [Polistes canadensis]|uniref:MATH and LRR domain-containing protein PFE0570w n=1 Tax=Polistes canadensis TaxID=91411 RepID=UPI000718E123|nr:PREDICTED: MATH and LRR domain-containing protein PFE0570w [Polistes canadensis]